MKKLILFLAILALFTGVQAQTVNFSSSNLPIISINTNGQEIVDEPKITADMGIVFNPGNARNNLSDPFNHYNGKIGIEIRGQSSQMFPMKSYSLELRDAAGNSVDKSLFGLPKEADWVLYAPFTDKTLMRNFLAYTMSRELGHWSSNCRFVEVVVNGDYKGVYVFMERIKRGSGRVPIPKMASTDISGDAVTGGYIFSLDKEPDGWFSSFPTPNSTNANSNRRFSYVYPKVENIVQEQKDYLKSYVDSFEKALASTKFQDPLVGVRRFANIPSFIDYFIVNEVSRNVDGYRLSTYFYKDRASNNGKIVAGPVWDYDLAFRNADYCNGSYTNGWAYQFNTVCPGDGAGLIPFWWNRFMQDTAFLSSLRCRWKEQRQVAISNTRLYRLIDSVSSLLGEAQVRHFQRWQILGKYVWPNPQPIPNSYAEEIATLKSWLDTRLQWIDANLPNSGACFDFPVNSVSTIIVSIAPNPVQSVSMIQVQSRFNQNVYLQVTDMLGRSIGSRKMAVKAGINQLPLNAEAWSSGIYYITITSEKGDKYTQKLVK